MKRIIAALDGLHYSTITRDYSIQLTKNSDAHLTAIFLDDMTNTSYKIYNLVVKEGVSEKKIKSYKEKDKITRINASHDFDSEAKKAGVQYNLQHDKFIALNELLHESTFADLLIIDSKESLSHHTEQSPTRFIKDLLSDVQCPVLLISQEYVPLKKVILLYDGSPSSVFAIKMFEYIMMPLNEHLSVELLTVNGMEDDLHLPDHKRMKAFLKAHFKNVTYTILKGLAETEITTHVQHQGKETLLVLGAYGRTALSNWFKSSLSGVLLKQTKLPMFITHYR